MISLRMRFASVACLSVLAVPGLASAAQASPVWERSIAVFPTSLQALSTQAQRVDVVADLARRLLAFGSSPRSTIVTSVVVPSGSGSSGSVTSAPVPPATSLTPASTESSPVGVPSAPVTDGPSWTATVVETGSISRLRSGAAVPVVPVVPEDAVVGETSTDRDQLIRMLAYEVGARTKVDPAALENIWRRTEDLRMRAVLSALAQVGTPYRAAGNQPGGFDCSGLTSYAWSQAGVKIARSSGDQINAASPRTFEQMLPGDIIWRPGHVGMYLGFGDAMVHSPQTGKTVEVRTIGKGVRFGSPLPFS